MSRAVPAVELDYWLRKRPAVDQLTNPPEPLGYGVVGSGTSR